MATCDADLVFTSSQEERSSLPPNCWGQLLPLGFEFHGHVLDKPEVSFGRSDDVDYSFNTMNPSHKFLNALSKYHFKLIRQTSSTGDLTVLYDTSSNGTYVNKELVGRNRKRVLQSGDEISLAKEFNRIFIYIDKSDQSNEKFPAEVRENYIVTRELGRGAMGEVRLAFRKESEERLAVKIIKKGKFSSSGHNAVTVATQIQREIAILKKIDHPCIIRVEDIIDIEDSTYLFLELIEGGELFDLIVNSKRFPEDVAKLHAFQMMSAIRYLHASHITHRDLKPENILVKSRDNMRTLIKVTDFGLGKFIDETSMMKTFCGTPNYLAPEILMSAGSGVYTKAVDLWSLGVIMFICLGGYPPFSKDYRDMDLRDQIIRGRYTFPPKFWRNISHRAIDFISRLLTVDSEQRMTAEEALKHEWLNDVEIQTEAQRLMYPGEDFKPDKGLTKKRGAAKVGITEDMETDEHSFKKAR